MTRRATMEAILYVERGLIVLADALADFRLRMWRP